MENRHLISALFCAWLALQVGGSACLGAQDPVEEKAKPETSALPLNLVRNGDFNTANESGDWPKDWGSVSPGSGRTWESEKNARFMRLLSQKPGQMQVLYRSLNLTPGEIEAMQVTIRYRTSGVKPGGNPGQDGRALIIFRDADGRLLDSNTPPLLFSNTTHEWTEVSAEILVPVNATKWEMIVGLLWSEAGTAEVSEVKAVALDGARAAKLRKTVPSGIVSNENWVKNGNFSEPDKNGKWPGEWGDGAPGMSWETDQGAHYVRLVSQEPGQMLMLNKTVPLQPGIKGIELMIRFRTSGILHGEHEWFDARTIVQFLDENGEKVEGAGDFVFTHKPAPTDWKQGVKSYIVPAGATQLRLMAGLFKDRAGTVDLAEIRVSPMTAANAELLKVADAANRLWWKDEGAASDRRKGKEIDAQLAATGNLVANGGFEKTGKEGGAEDWGKQSGDNGVTWQEEKGEHFMRIVSDNPEKIRMLYKMIPLNLEARAVEVKIRYRTAGIVKGPQFPGDARVNMHFMDGTRIGHLENGKNVGPDPSAIEFSAEAKDWTEVSRRYPVPEGATKLQFMPGLWNVEAGTLDLAEIQVRPFGDAEGKAPVDANTSDTQKKAEPAALAAKDPTRTPIHPELPSQQSATEKN